MGSSKEEKVKKILSLTKVGLSSWIKKRLKGNDPYFAIYVGYEPDLSGFIADAFKYIENKDFRKNFIDTLDSLVKELGGYSKDKTKRNKGYIYELLTLCGYIDDFANISNSIPCLIDITNSDKLKGITVCEAELQLVILNVLATIGAGDVNDFWLEKMMDNSNRYYANIAFYALLEKKCNIKVILENIHILIDSFFGELELELSIWSLLDRYNSKVIYDYFKENERKLSSMQKKELYRVIRKNQDRKK